jgi:hypothetical protein
VNDSGVQNGGLFLFLIGWRWAKEKDLGKCLFE